jgi:hypothetical protein
MARCHLALLIPMSALAACDPMYGLSSSTSLPYLPDPDCVESAIEAAEGVDWVRREPELEKMFRGRETRVWTYGHMEYENVLSLGSSHGDDISMVNGTVLRKPMLAAHREAFEPVMHAINREIEDQCGAPIAANVKLWSN